jgi:alkaline phosphatase
MNTSQHKQKGYIETMKKFAKMLAAIIVSLTICIALLGCAQTETSKHNYTVKGNAVDISFYAPSSTTESYPELHDTRVKNIIFCIGDGMGLGQISLARMKAAGPDGTLYMERMPVSGFVRTHSADALVTDSAAAGTSLASGVKTNNGMIGIMSDGISCQTILEAAKASGMATGLVVTSRITDATPAAFASHVTSRKMQDRIAEQLIANKVNVLFGGGKEYFLLRSDSRSKRNDQKNLIERAKKAGYLYIRNAEELKTANRPYILGLFQLGPLTTIEPEPSLAELTIKAIDILDREGKNCGFFLMIEGSQIDWACHDNDAARTIRQTLLFDQAVKAAIDFALEDKHTLVIVTADHETGGLTIKDGSLKGDDLEVNWSTGGHSAMPVPIYAFGPKADIFAGTYDNTEVPKKFAKLLGINLFPKAISDEDEQVKDDSENRCDLRVENKVRR